MERKRACMCTLGTGQASEGGAVRDGKSKERGSVLKLFVLWFSMGSLINTSFRSHLKQKTLKN